MNSDISNGNKNKICANFITEYNPNEKLINISSDFDEKITEFKKNPEKLIIVTDFDFTLTKKFGVDTNYFSSYCVMEFSEFMSENYRVKNKALFDEYSKYENDITLDFQTRDELMKKWFKDNLELILLEKLTKEDFQKMILQAEKNFYYRYGILELFELIHSNDIPIFIISGGIYEIIEESLKVVIPYYKELKDKNLIHILSNKFIYDNSNNVCGFEEPFVYTFNKGETLKRIFKDYHTDEENIIVMGDHLNDTDTIKHLDYLNEIKIGFINFFEDSLNEQQIKLIEAYQLKYDVCIINDGNLTFVNSLLKKILSSKAKANDII